MANISGRDKNNAKEDEKNAPGWGYLLAAGGAAVLAGAAAYAVGYSSGKEECHQYQRQSSSNPQNKQFSSATECAICINKIKPVKVLQCGHTFHENCVNPWLNQKSDCPICRAAHKK